jgi:hypothetical protein
LDSAAALLAVLKGPCGPPAMVLTTATVYCTVGAVAPHAVVVADAQLSETAGGLLARLL